MSKLNLILGLVIAASVALSSNVAAADYKIGVVQAVRVLESAPQADAAKKKLESEFAGKEKSLVSKQKELKALEDRAPKDSAIMSESERARRERVAMNMRR